MSEERAKANREAAKDRAPQSDPGREAEGERSYSIDELREDGAALLHVSEFTLAAALANTNRKSLTLSQAEKLVNDTAAQPSVTSEVEA